MKRLFLVLIVAVLWFGCRKPYTNTGLPSDTGRIEKGFKFFNQDDELPKSEPKMVLVSFHNNQTQKVTSKLNVVKHV